MKSKLSDSLRLYNIGKYGNVGEIVAWITRVLLTVLRGQSMCVCLLLRVEHNLIVKTVFFLFL
jgi:hypothetical protein